MKSCQCGECAPGELCRDKRTVLPTGIEGQVFSWLLAKYMPEYAAQVRQIGEDLEQRKAYGVTKYPTELKDNKAPLKARVRHAYEESLDESNYLTWSEDGLGELPEGPLRKHVEGALAEMKFREIAHVVQLRELLDVLECFESQRARIEREESA